MPELPDVETFRRLFERRAKGHRIRAIEIRRPAIVRRASPRRMRRALVGRTVRGTRRRGKTLYALTDGPAAVFHFGMNGSFRWDEEPEGTRAVFVFDHARLAYANPRMLGGISVAGDVDRSIRDLRLGPDALDVTPADLAGKKGAIKAALLDQSFIAGIGNVYADEILFQLRLHPGQDISEVPPRRLANVIVAVMRRAIEAVADVKRMPKSWLLPHRRANGKCPRCGEKLLRVRFHQRSAYHCPLCQRR